MENVTAYRHTCQYHIPHRIHHPRLTSIRTYKYLLVSSSLMLVAWEWGVVRHDIMRKRKVLTFYFNDKGGATLKDEQNKLPLPAR